MEHKGASGKNKERSNRLTGENNSTFPDTKAKITIMLFIIHRAAERTT
jgi:hypothetical protein